MRIIPPLAGVALAGLVGCGGGGAPAPRDCVALFRQYDAIEATMSTSGWRDDRTIRPELQWTTSVIRQNRCISFSDALHFDVAAGSVRDSGPRLAPPLRVHAGVVTSMADDAAAREFFAAHGVPGTSVGSAALGRRIYIGPFATRGALDEAMALARSAGFAYPYAARF